MDTKGEGLFKNLRMRLKLNANKIGKPTTDDEPNKDSRLQKFLRLFKSCSSKRRSRKVAPLQKAITFPLPSEANEQVSVIYLEEGGCLLNKTENAINGSAQANAEVSHIVPEGSQVEAEDIQAKAEVTHDGTEGAQVRTAQSEEENQVEVEAAQVEVEAAKVDVEDAQVEKEALVEVEYAKVKSESALVEAEGLEGEGEVALDGADNNLFERIDQRVEDTDRGNRRRLAPITRPAPIHLKHLKVEYAIHDTKWYRADFSPKVERPVTPRPATPRLCKDPKEARQQISEQGLQEKQHRAEEIRDEVITERVQNIGTRRDRFEQRLAEVEEAKRRKVEEMKERQEKASEKKSQVDAEKSEVYYCSYN